MKWINRLYIIFVGILLAMTTGFGVAAFYPEPQRPTYPVTRIAPVPESCYKTPESQQTAECQKLIEGDADQRQKEQVEYDVKNREFENKNAGYTRTAIFLGVLIGAVYAIFGLGFIKKSQLVSNGFMLGAVLTAILTRLLIMLASFGSGVTGTEGANTLSYMEFGLLVLATIGVTVVGFKTLTEEKAGKKK
jgi:hypothetical protein